MSVNDAQQYHQNMVHYLRGTLSYTDTSAKSLGWLPAGAVVIDGGIAVTTVFNAGTNNNVNVGFRNAGDGTADDVDEYATLVAATSVGVKPFDELATAAQTYLAEGAEIVATYVPTGTASTAGSAEVFIAYIVSNE